MAEHSDLTFTPATELRDLIRSRRVSPVEILESVLARVEDVQPRLYPFVTIDAEAARTAARAAEEAVMRQEPLGALHGIPISIKDLEPTRGLRTTYGSKFSEHNVPTFDSIVVERVRAAGGIIFAKTNTPNYGHKDSCDNLLMPPRATRGRRIERRAPRAVARRWPSRLALARWRMAATAPARSASRRRCAEYSV